MLSLGKQLMAGALRLHLLLCQLTHYCRSAWWDLVELLSFRPALMALVSYPHVAKALDKSHMAVSLASQKSAGSSRETECERGTVGTGGGAARIGGNVDSALHRRSKSEAGQQIDPEIAVPDVERCLFEVSRSLPAVVFQLYRDPHGVYSFLYIGGDTQSLLGGNSSALIRPGITDFSWIRAEDRLCVMTELERSAREGAPAHAEFRIEFCVEGEPPGFRWVRAELVPHIKEAGGVEWSGYCVDASIEHERADELARARDFAEAASRAKDDFLAMMSHEIRTPMNGVLGLLEVLESTPLNTDQGGMLRMIHESAGALLQILDDLLDYSKIEAGRLTIECEPVDLRDLIDNAVGLLAGHAHEKGLKVRIDVEPGIAASLRGDSVRLRQILFNLLSNAIKFTPAGEIDVRVVLAGQEGTKQAIAITVEDTGIGIEADVQAQLFEPFVQAESSTTRRFGGTGLGLTICRKLVDLMGGTLDLQSTPGKGTRITMHLKMQVEVQSHAAGRLRGRRGLIATADAHVARVMTHFGQALGIELRSASLIDVAHDPRAAFAGADLIFVDERLELPKEVLSLTGVIRLTEQPKPTGYRVVDHTVRLSVNPISWRGLGAACAAALSGLPSVPAGAVGRHESGVAPPDRERAIATGRLVLVAEDHPVNQELIRHQLALLGFACDVVNDGVEALVALGRTRYGFLITDCHMPNLSGYELAREVRRRERGGANGTRHLPILGITANTAPEDLRLCREAGMDDCLIKPTRLATLRDHLARWFSGDSARPMLALPQEVSDRTEGADSKGSTGTKGAMQDPAITNPNAFVPVDLGHMAQLWGSESTVKGLLAAFVSAVRDDLRALPPLLENVEGGIDDLWAWHHRVAGAAGVLQYPPLVELLEAYRRGITEWPRGKVRHEGLLLVERCDALLNGIEEQSALLP